MAKNEKWIVTSPMSWTDINMLYLTHYDIELFESTLFGVMMYEIYEIYVRYLIANWCSFSFVIFHFLAD